MLMGPVFLVDWDYFIIYLSNFCWLSKKSIDSGSLELLYLLSFQVFEVKYKVESHSIVCFYCCILSRWGGSVSIWCICVTLPKSKLRGTFLDFSLWALFCLHWTLTGFADTSEERQSFDLKLNKWLKCPLGACAPPCWLKKHMRYLRCQTRECLTPKMVSRAANISSLIHVSLDLV